MPKKKTSSPLVKTSKTIQKRRTSKLTEELKKKAQTLAEAKTEIPFWLPSGVSSLDFAINSQGRGYPGGRLIYIKSSKESEGKSTLIGHALAEMQKLGGVAKLYDAEGTFDSEIFASRIPGLDLDALLIPKSDESAFLSLEETLDDIKDTIKVASDYPETPLLLAWDTIAATPTQASLDGKAGNIQVGKHARLLSEILRVLIPFVKDHGQVILMFANQRRFKIGGSRPGFMPPEETEIGGKGPNFHSSVTIELKKGKTLEKSKKKIGIHVRAYVAKNKVGEPFRTGEFDLNFKTSIAGRESLFYPAYDLGVIENVTATKYEILGENTTQAEFGKRLVADDDYYESVRELVREKLNE